MNKLDRQLAKLEGKRDRGEISEDVFQAVRDRLEAEAATKSPQSPEGTVWQQEYEVTEAIKSVESKRSSILAGSGEQKFEQKREDPIAALIAMRAKGEISIEEFARARTLLDPEANEETSSKTASVGKIHDRDATLQALAARYKTADGHLPQSGNPVASANKSKPRQAKTWVGLIFLAILGVGYLSSNKQGAPDQTASTAKCFSPWDGSNSDFISQLKRSLRDPDSFEHMQTKFSQDSSGRLLATMEYRAKNGFGGYNVAQAVAVIDASSCNVLEILP